VLTAGKQAVGAKGKGALLPVYAQFPVRPVSGAGSWLVDESGDRWLDAYGGHAVASVGHSHPRVVRAIAEQAEKLLFYSSAVAHPAREALAERLAALSPDPLAHVFFVNSGAEANENALHLARRATGRTAVVSVTGGWHGRTAATLAVTDGARYEAAARRAGMPISRKIPFGDTAAVGAAVDETVAAVIVEPVQGIHGARDCPPEFLSALRAACDDAGAALLFDEIQCGSGRAGAFTAAEAFGVVPDCVTMAKGLAGGLPIGAVVAAPRLVEGLEIGDLGSTFGGGPVPCAAALAVLDVIEGEDLLSNVRTVGAQLADGALAAGIPAVQGKGLLLGLRLGRPAAPVQRALFGHRVLTGTANDPEILRLMPPLNFTREEADLLLDALGKVWDR